MSKVNRGKQFESIIFKSFSSIPSSTIIRLIDPPRGFKGVHNPCDYVIYKYPIQILLECKTHYGNTIPFSAMPQLDTLANYEHTKGVVSGVVIWFIDHNKTVFIPSSILNKLKQCGKKSVNINTLEDDIGVDNLIYISGKKKIVTFEYNINEFFECLLTHKSWYEQEDM